MKTQNDLKNQIRNEKTKIEELNLSEILFELKPNLLVLPAKDN